MTRTRTAPQSGQVIGTAGGGLVGAKWAANADVARIGRTGELRTARLLDHLARDRAVTVMHDLRIPIPGYSASIDHAVVAGTTVLLIDTKVWKPGRYWTLVGATFRGWSRFEHAKTRTPALAHDSISRYLAGRGLRARMPTPLVAVWPSSKKGALSVRWLRMDGCRPILAEKLPRKPADQRIVAALAALVNR